MYLAKSQLQPTFSLSLLHGVESLHVRLLRLRFLPRVAKLLSIENGLGFLHEHHKITQERERGQFRLELTSAVAFIVVFLAILVFFAGAFSALISSSFFCCERVRASSSGLSEPRIASAS